METRRIVAFAQQSKWGSIISGVSFVLICIATLTPGAPPPPAGSIPVCRGWCDDPLLADFARNIVLFMPLGFGLRLAGVRTRWAVLFGSALSATVELLQIRVVVGRDASFLDWISNTIGTVLGVLAAVYLYSLLRPRPRTAARLAICALGGWVFVLALGGWGIQPAPTGFAYWGERTPRLRTFPPFRGELRSGRVNGFEVPSGPLPNEDTVRKSLRAGRVRVDATVLSGPSTPPAEIAPIVRIADGTQREILLLGRGGKELVFRYRSRATAMRLEAPAFALARVFDSGSDGDEELLDPSESLSAVLDSGRLVLSARNQHRLRQLQFDLSPAVAWSFFVPWDEWLGPNTSFLSTLWLGALLLPAGYWTRGAARERKGRGRWIGLLALATVVATIAVLPRIFGLPAAPASHYVAGIVGLGAGWILAIFSSRSQPAR